MLLKKLMWNSEVLSLLVIKQRIILFDVDECLDLQTLCRFELLNGTYNCLLEQEWDHVKTLNDCLEALYVANSVLVINPLLLFV